MSAIKLTTNVINAINNNVLCWLATSSKENIPNVSPKEIFRNCGTTKIIVANIASPQTVKNIKENENVCISFIDILVQKGFKVTGKANIITKEDIDFNTMENLLLEMTGGKFPFASITVIDVQDVKKIVAPKYILYPETTEEEQIDAAKKAYNLRD